jgi:hypothetical protein
MPSEEMTIPFHDRLVVRSVLRRVDADAGVNRPGRR